MALVFLGLGSNLGDGRANITEAWQLLSLSPKITALALSRPYLTAPMGMESDQWFTNAVGVVNSSLAAEELLDCLLTIEQEMGRDRKRGKDRRIDLDLLYYNDLVMDSGRLTVPHPEIPNRMFVLAPMEELAPDHQHPVNQLTTREMRKSLRYEVDQQIKTISWSDES